MKAGELRSVAGPQHRTESRFPCGFVDDIQEIVNAEVEALGIEWRGIAKVVLEFVEGYFLCPRQQRETGKNERNRRAGCEPGCESQFRDEGRCQPNDKDDRLGNRESMIGTSAGE